MAWLLLIFSTGLLVLLHKKWKKWKKWWVVGIVTALFASSLASTELGGWLAGLLRSLLNLLPVSGALVAAVLVLLLVPAVVYGFVHDRKADKWEMTALILLPLLFIIASGPVAAHGGDLTDAITGFGSNGLGYLVSG
ncbi:hypothetical protein [Amycolatopsis dongchuanensis]|uniref:Uncharacterized protein n=1 Tax=Amycolatopsis dongchuanensis TaxID=1070866 RepID=A0ABP8VWY8_9PSEU